MQEYCDSVSYGVVPSFLYASDLHFARGNKQPEIVLVMDTVKTVLTSLLSYALAVFLEFFVHPPYEKC